jgi:multidrug efflux system membrane fusion protein
LTTEADQAAVVGLNRGEVVSLTGFDKLQEGSKITIQSDQNSGAQSSMRQADNNQAESVL